MDDRNQKNLSGIIKMVEEKDSKSLEHEICKFLFPNAPAEWDFGVSINPPDAYGWDEDE